MKLVVINGFRAAKDLSGKLRFGVIIKIESGAAMIAPCTTAPIRKNNRIHAGDVRLTNKSAAYKGSGFTAEMLAICLNEAAIYGLDTSYLENMAVVGTLDTKKDNRLNDDWEKQLKTIDWTRLQFYLD